MLLIIDYSPILNKIYYNQKYIDVENQKYELFSRSLNIIAGLENDTKQDVTLIIALDGHKSSYYKRTLYADYKGTRDDRKTIIEACNEYIIRYCESKPNITALRHLEHEADDLVASIIKSEYDNFNTIEVFTTDKDYYQLIDDKVTINRNGKRVNKYIFEQEFGFDVKYFVDYLALVGDKVDNVPGCEGIGPVGAKKLVKEFNTVAEIIYTAEQQDDVLMKKSVYKKINTYCNMLELSYKLVKMIDNISLNNIKKEKITYNDIMAYKRSFDTTYTHYLSY